jgi:hypothetical protein
VLFSDVANGIDLSGFDQETYPSLMLRANYTTDNKAISPKLDSWQLTWTASLVNVFLPLIHNDHNQ